MEVTLELRKPRMYNVKQGKRVLGKVAERVGYCLWRTKHRHGSAPDRDAAVREVVNHGS